jgi:hypothetical protein
LSPVEANRFVEGYSPGVATNGSQTVDVNPVPTVLSAETSPSCVRTMSRQMALSAADRHTQGVTIARRSRGDGDAPVGWRRIEGVQRPG